MASPFEAASLSASRAVDAVFGDAGGWRLVPMTAADVNARPAADASRAVVDLTAVFKAPYARAFQGSAEKPGIKPERPGWSGSRPTLGFERGAVPWSPRRGDIAERRADGARWQVVEVRPDGLTRWLCDLVAI